MSQVSRSKMSLRLNSISSTWKIISILTLVAAIHGQECFEKGECINSPFISRTDAVDAQDCLVQCQSDADCQYSTFYEQERGIKYGECYEFLACDEFDNKSCQDCYSGDRFYGTEDLTCFEEEECGGDPISTSTEYSTNDCLWTCKSVAECNWFTFDVIDGTCMIFDECGDNIKCSSCLSGERACGNRRDYTKLVVFGGRDGSSVFSSAEVIDLSSSSSSNCPMPNYPVMIEQHAASLLYKDTIKSCGGKFNEKSCYDFSSFDNVWTETPELIDEREFPSSSVFGDDIFLISGGYTSTVTTEFWDGQQFVGGPDLPEPMYRACQVTLDYNRVFFLEGYSRNGYILDWQSQNFSPITPMTISRQYSACGLVQSPDGSGPEVVVAGYGTSEIYNVESGTWQSGPQLPHTGYEMSSAQLFNTFLLVGGNSGVSTGLQTILKYDIYEQDWINVANLQNGRYFSAAVAVPDDFFQC